MPTTYLWKVFVYMWLRLYCRVMVMFLFMIKVLNGHFMVTAINIDMVIDYVMVADVVMVRILVMVMFAIKVRVMVMVMVMAMVVVKLKVTVYKLVLYRDMKKGEQAALDILDTTGQKVELLSLDLADTGDLSTFEVP